MVACAIMTPMTIQLKDPTRYHIIESDLGPLISESRSTVYDVLEMQNKGYGLYEISEIFNLTPLQVETALDYIDQHRERLQPQLDEILKIADERRRHYERIHEEIREKIAKQPMTEKRAKLLAIKAQILAEQKKNAASSE